MSDKVKAAEAVMELYYEGDIGKEEAIQGLLEIDAIHLVECGAPWDEGGDFICTMCAQNEK